MERFTPHHLADVFAEFEVQKKRVVTVFLNERQVECLSDPLWRQMGWVEGGPTLRLWGADLKMRPDVPDGAVVLMTANKVETVVRYEVPISLRH